MNKKRNAAWEERRFHLWVIFLHLLSVVVLGLSFFPMVYFLYAVWHAMAPYAAWLKILAFSFSIGLGYFIFGTAIILFTVFIKNLLGFTIKPGLYHIHSWDCLRWMGYNSMILIANACFLDVLRISPFQALFYRLMGAKIGKNVNVNTGGLADLAMLEIGDNVTIGGGVALICHASERGFIRLAPTKLGKGVSIGISSVVFPGCDIGEGASIGPGSVVPKGTQIPAKAYWGGNPIRDLRLERRNG